MIQSPLLTGFDFVLHGFATREDSKFPEPLITSKQVHGTEICLANGTERDLSGFDILVTESPDVAVAVRTADCLPVLLVEPERKIVAAVHAGWKGTLARASEKAVRKIIAMGGRADRLSAVMGPSMSRGCYEVEADVANPFRQKFPDWWMEILTPVSKTQWLLDVPETNRRQLTQAGVRPENIDHIDLCTHCREDLFWSYRRDGDAAGRTVNFIMMTQGGIPLSSE